MREVVGDRSAIIELVKKTLKLPDLAEVLVKLNQIVADAGSTADDVARVISTDPTVSTNILRIVNSPYYGLQVRVSSVNLAVSIMGFSMTKKVALKAAVLSMFSPRNRFKRKPFDAAGFWRHSTFTGVAARVMGSESDHFREQHGEDIYICGLLHDIGKVILLANEEQEFEQVLEEAARSARPELEVEAELLGFNHADVGSALAISWSLPEDLTIAIRYHHAPGKDPLRRPLSSLIHLADHLAWKSGHPSMVDMEPPELDATVFDGIGLDPRTVEGLLPRIQEDFDLCEMPW